MKGNIRIRLHLWKHKYKTFHYHFCWNAAACVYGVVSSPWRWLQQVKSSEYVTNACRSLLIDLGFPYTTKKRNIHQYSLHRLLRDHHSMDNLWQGSACLLAATCSDLICSNQVMEMQHQRQGEYGRRQCHATGHFLCLLYAVSVASACIRILMRYWSLL